MRKVYTFHLPTKEPNKVFKVRRYVLTARRITRLNELQMKLGCCQSAAYVHLRREERTQQPQHRHDVPQLAYFPNRLIAS